MGLPWMQQRPAPRRRSSPKTGKPEDAAKAPLPQAAPWDLGTWISFGLESVSSLEKGTRRGWIEVSGHETALALVEYSATRVCSQVCAFLQGP